MDSLKTLHIFLEEGFKKSAENGAHNLMNRIETAMSSVGVSVDYHLNTAKNRNASQDFQGYSLFHMEDPFHDRALNLRRAYFYPFWRIEKVAERWNFRVASMPYPADKQESNMAKTFANSMRKRHFGDQPVTREGHIFMPLQGKISKHRSFQSCSPLEMIEQTLATDATRSVIASLHPNEAYSEGDLARLRALEGKHTRFRLSDTPSDALLASCDYVVTQNSSVALKGFFLQKPAVLFAQIDFHHIAGNVGRVGLEAAFRHVHQPAQSYDSYLLWFLRKTAINAGNENAEARILAAMRKSGWEL
ncbi:MAG: hypothetical protein V7657_02810 [Falsihalocynthiibacter arcticus]